VVKWIVALFKIPIMVYRQYQEWYRAIDAVKALECGQADGDKSVLSETEEAKRAATMWFIHEMDQARYIFTSAVGKEPQGWIMGLNEYLDLKAAIFSHMTVEQRKTFKEVTKYRGLPVRIKSSPGIELEMDIDSALHFQRVGQQMVENKKDML